MSDSKLELYEEVMKGGPAAYGNRIFPPYYNLECDKVSYTREPKFINLDLWLQQVKQAIDHRARPGPEEEYEERFEEYFGKYLKEFIEKVRETCLDLDSVEHLILCFDLNTKKNGYGEKVNSLIIELLSMFPDSVLRYKCIEAYVNLHPELHPDAIE